MFNSFLQQKNRAKQPGFYSIFLINQNSFSVIYSHNLRGGHFLLNGLKDRHCS